MTITRNVRRVTRVKLHAVKRQLNETRKEISGRLRDDGEQRRGLSERGEKKKTDKGVLSGTEFLRFVFGIL